MDFIGEIFEDLNIDVLRRMAGKTLRLWHNGALSWTVEYK